MKGIVKKFNPLEMDAEDVLALATGREKKLKLMLEDMQRCLQKSGQHFIIYGPRGIGKSFFTRLLKIHHDQTAIFKNSLFIQLPEEQENINFTSDLMDVISTVLEGGKFADNNPRWSISDGQWVASKERLKEALKKAKLEQSVAHVFVTQENMQVFIPKLDDTGSGRMREFLSDFSDITIIGSSLRPDLDSDYSKKLFHVFQKVDLQPWESVDFLAFYKRKAQNSVKAKEQLEQLQRSENKIKAIATFTGGSPRLAVILSELILDKNILDTTLLLDGIIDDLTTYYQDLTNDIPNKSKILFDMIIRKGENMTQSALAASFNPPLQQNTIARSFSWLTDNYYIINKKQSRGNTKLFFVRDRLYVLYYQKRQVYADVPFSFVGIFVDFLTEYFTQKEWKNQLGTFNLDHPYSQPLLYHYSKKIGLAVDAASDAATLRNRALDFVENASNNKYYQDKLTEALSLIKEEGSEGASKILSELITQQPNNPNAYILLGYNLENLGEDQEAITQYNKSIELDPSSSFSYYRLALFHEDQNELAKAAELYEKAINHDPEDADYRYSYADLLDKMSKPEKAIQEYEKVIQLNPEFDQAYHDLAIVLMDSGNEERAINMLYKAIEVNPYRALTWRNLAAIFEEQENYKKAIELYKKAIELGSEEEKEITYYYLGGVYEKTGDKSVAFHFYEKALELEPKNISIITGLAKRYFQNNNVDKAIRTLAFGINGDDHSAIAIGLLYRFIITSERWEQLITAHKEFQIIKNTAAMGIGSAISDVLLERPEPKNRFFLFKNAFKTISESDEINTTRVVISMSVGLFLQEDYTTLRQIIEEINEVAPENPSLEILWQVLNYVSADEPVDLETLHPDARMALQVILKLESKTEK